MLKVLYKEKEYTNVHLSVSNSGFHELRGRNSASYSHKTNILGYELWIRLWNYVSAATQAKYNPVQFFQKLCIIPEN